jgi:aspartate aminotransferase
MTSSPLIPAPSTGRSGPSALDVGRISARLEGQTAEARGIGSMARKLIGSEILKIAGEIRELVASGAEVLNLTVGDFSSKEFPIPEELAAGITQAVADGHTNYPPAEGVRECREAVRDLFRRRLGLAYPLESILVAGGARPMIATTYLALVNPGDRVVYNVPSWNNNHYCTLSGAEAVEVVTQPQHGFLPTAADLAPHLDRAKLICLNTPQNPTGTVMSAGELGAIARLVVDENRRREASGATPVYLMFDQVYWWLTFRGTTHTTPVGLVPEVAPYTIFVDGISKGFASTGLRVGWAVGPKDVIARMSALLTHLGAWAPRPEQIATARFLADDATVDAYLARIRQGVEARLEILAGGVEELKVKGHPVEAIAPAGAIYLSLRIGIVGRTAPGGRLLATDEDVRKYLLSEAGIGLVPFQAFGLREDTGWFRASVGAVSASDCRSIGPRLQAALQKLR